jgi:hypothetical protein
MPPSMPVIIMSLRRPFLFISLLVGLATTPVASWAQVTTLPSGGGAVPAQKTVDSRRPAATIPGAASDLPLLALLGLGLLLTGAGMVSSIRPSRNRA